MHRPHLLLDWPRHLTPLPETHPNRFAPTALWFCTSQITGRTTPVNGSLAQVLQAYPRHFELALFSAPSVTQETL